MELNEYHKRAMEFRGWSISKEIPYAALGLAGEAGEVADKVKKVLRDNSGRFDECKRIEIAKEIGDVMWYCALLANNLGYDLDFIAKMNLVKLKDRQSRGTLGGEGDNR